MREYDEDPIRVHSAFTWEGYEKMRWNMGRATSKGGRVAVFLLLTLVLGAYLSVSFKTKTVQDGLLVGALAVGIVVLFSGVVSLLTHMAGKRIYQKAKRRIGEGYDFTFFGDSWSAAQKSENYESQRKRKYSAIYKVMEADDAFYIFIDSIKVYLVCKAGIENAEPQELGALLRGAVKPSRYKVLKVPVRPRR